jgi:tetratricopeptide (TPR) repeat protein
VSTALPKKILYISNEIMGLKDLTYLIEKQGSKLFTANDMSSALYHFNQNFIDVVLIQSEFSELRGTNFAQRLRANESPERARCGIIIVQGKNEIPRGEIALQGELGGIENINYPFKSFAILPYITRANAWRKAELALLELNDTVLTYHRKSKNFDKALAIVQEKLGELGERGPQLLLELYKDAERWQESLAIVNSLLAKVPAGKEDLPLISEKATILMRLSNFDEAREWFEKADKIAPENVDRLVKMADVYLEKGDGDTAVKKMEQVIGLTPDAPEKKFDMFDQLFSKGFGKQAKNLCKSTTAPEEIVKHYNNRGVLFSKDGDSDNAMGAYEQALQFYPKNRENHKIHFNIALALINRKTSEAMLEAYAQIKRAIELNPKYEKAQNLKITIEAALVKTGLMDEKGELIRAEPAEPEEQAS